MAPWGDSKLTFYILFITCCCAVIWAEVPVDCCLKVYEKEIDKRAVADYHRQIRGQGCSIDAVIFVTRHGKDLCVTAHKPWVDELMKHADDLKMFCKKKNYRPKRCFGVKRV